MAEEEIGSSMDDSLGIGEVLMVRGASTGGATCVGLKDEVEKLIGVEGGGVVVVVLDALIAGAAEEDLADEDDGIS